MIANVDYSNKEYYRRYLFLKFLPGIFYPFVLYYFYRQKFGKQLNLIFPKKMSEKILKSCLCGVSSLKSRLADKLEAKKYVTELIPELKVANVYQVADSFEKLDFSQLPKTFVLKTNHAWKSHILVEDKNELSDSEKKQMEDFYKNVLKINYAYWGTPELQYKNIKRKVFAEEYLASTKEGSIIKEYEVYCFNGEPEFLTHVVSYSGKPGAVENYPEKVDLSQMRIFFADWTPADFKIRFENDIPSPNTLNKDLIIEYAKKLSKDFNFVRVDFFEVDDVLYFGEYTFTPQSGFIDFYPREKDLYYGQKI